MISAIRRRPRGWWLPLASALCVLLPWASPARANGPEVVLVFDGSGSMWGKIGGSSQAKFELATEALDRAIAAHGKQARYGLVTFGLQSRGGCNAAEVAVAPGSSGADALAPLASFNPKGRGPLTLGLRTAGAALKVAKGPRRIIIIHDDPDNCQQDVCEAAADLKKAMPDLVVHSVSLGTKPSHAGAMACLAKITGGTAAETADASEAAAAITAALRASAGAAAPVAAARPSPDAKPAAPQPALDPTPGLTLSVVLAAGKPPLGDGVAWRIGAADATTLRPVAGARPSIALAPGSYAVEAEVGGRVVRKTFTVADGPRTRAEISLDAARLRFTVASPPGQPPGSTAAGLSATLEIRSPEASEGSAPVWLGRLGDGRVIVPAGRYRAIVHAGTVRRETDINVDAGEDRTTEVPLQTGSLALSAAPGTEGAVVFTIEADDATSPSGRRVIARSAAPAPRFVLAAGTYYITAQGGAGEARDSVAITAGASLERKLSLAATPVKVMPRLKGRAGAPGAVAEHTVWRLDGSAQPVVTSTAMDPVFRLVPGRYRIRSQIGHQNAAVVRDFEVAAIPAGELPIEHDAGTLRLSLAPGVTSRTDVYWRVMDRAGRAIWRADSATVDAVLKAGTYAITVDAGRASFQATAVITSGQHTELKLGPR